MIYLKEEGIGDYFKVLILSVWERMLVLFIQIQKFKISFLGYGLKNGDGFIQRFVEFKMLVGYMVVIEIQFVFSEYLLKE